MNDSNDSVKKRKHHGRFAGFDLDKRGSGPTPVSSSLNLWLSRHGRSEPKRDLLCSLWKNWRTVMGPELSSTAIPLGTRSGVLLIGGEDQFILQELSFSVPEILERVNAFMDEEYFQKVELRLLMGRTDLRIIDTTVVPASPPPPRPENLGSLSLPPESPAAAAYEAYLRLFTERQK